jgi:hypothetical protein
VSLLERLIIRLTIWQLRCLCRLIALLPLPWVLGQDVVELTPDERVRLVAMLGAWTMGRRCLRAKRQDDPRTDMTGRHGARSTGTRARRIAYEPAES